MFFLVLLMVCVAFMTFMATIIWDKVVFLKKADTMLPYFSFIKLINVRMTN